LHAKAAAPLRITAEVLGTAALTALLVLVVADRVGRRWEAARHFLRNYRFPDWAETNTVVHMDYVLASREVSDVVVLGDSTTMVAVDPVQLETRTGLRAYNLSLPGILGIDAYLWELALYLKSRPAPRVVVLASHPLDYGHVPPGWTELRERFSVAYGLWPDGHRLAVDHPPWFYAREGLRVTVGGALGGYDRYLGDHNLLIAATNREFAARVAKQRGFSPRKGSLTEAAARRPNPYAVFDVSPWYAQHVADLAELARKEDMILLIRPTPVMAREIQEDARPWLAWLREFARRHDHVVRGEPLFLLYEPSFFSEAVHLNAEGAQRFTDRIADQLRDLHIQEDTRRDAP